MAELLIILHCYVNRFVCTTKLNPLYGCYESTSAYHQLFLNDSFQYLPDLHPKIVVGSFTAEVAVR